MAQEAHARLREAETMDHASAGGHEASSGEAASARATASPVDQTVHQGAEALGEGRSPAYCGLADRRSEYRCDDDADASDFAVGLLLDSYVCAG